MKAFGRPWLTEKRAAQMQTLSLENSFLYEWFPRLLGFITCRAPLEARELGMSYVDPTMPGS